MTLRCFICTLLIVCTTSITLAQKWSFADYDKNDCKNFQQLNITTQVIDFDHIDSPLLNAAVFYATNVQRKKYNRKPFVYDLKLEQTARQHSEDMVRLNFFSHTSEVNKKKNLSNRLDIEGIDYQMCAENIAIAFGIELESGRSYYPPSLNGGYFSYELNGMPIGPHSYWSFALALVDSWMNSPGHRANILNKELTHLGCGNVLFTDEKGQDAVPQFKCTQNFCTYFKN